MNTKKGITFSKSILALIVLCSFGAGFCFHAFISGHRSEYISGKNLKEKEYTDGLIIFECPENYTCEASGGGDFPLMHVIMSDTSNYESYTEATIESDWDEDNGEMNNEAFLNLWSTYHSKDINKKGFAVIDERKKEEKGKEIYEKDSYYFYKSDTLTNRFVLIHDKKSRKICLIDWVSTQNNEKNIQAFEELVASVRFDE